MNLFRQYFSGSDVGLTVSMLTLLGCVGFYFLIVRPFNVIRILFGMKPRKSESQPKKVAPVPEHSASAE